LSPPRIFIITGAMAAGKSTVAEAVARRLPRSVHLRGDVFRKMIVNGAAEMGPELSDEALAQLNLRHTLACEAARRYHEAGFSVVYQDIILGEALESVAGRLADLSPIVVVLVADVETLAERDRKRSKTGYSQDFPPQVLADAVARNTLSTALTIDTSRMEVDAVVDRILAE
jgi:predicted kinase